MQNIDTIWFLQPLSFVALSVGLIIYWRIKRRFTGGVLLYSFLAYAGAIALKEILQSATYVPFKSDVGSNNFYLGLYFGLQTAIFEVGGAFVVARFASSRKKMKASDAEGYGLGLAFWENGVLFGFAIANKSGIDLCGS